MIKSAAIIKDKALAPWKELRLQKKRTKKQATLERRATKVHRPSPIGYVKEVKEEIDEISPPNREELEAKAKEIGIKFTKRTTDKKLEALISEQIGE